MALVVYQLGLLFAGAGFTIASAAALIVLGFMLYMLLRRNRYDENHLTRNVQKL